MLPKPVPRRGNLLMSHDVVVEPRVKRREKTREGRNGRIEETEISGNSDVEGRRRDVRDRSPYQKGGERRKAGGKSGEPRRRTLRSCWRQEIARGKGDRGQGKSF